MNSSNAQPPAGRFNGRHMAAILVVFFGIVIVVNFYMAHLARATFAGVVVKNSYVASQNFNRWLDEAHREGELGWHATATRGADGRIGVALRNVPAGAAVTGTAWHPLGHQPDQPLEFVAAPGGRFVSTAPIAAGRWTLRLEVVANGHRWRTEEPIG